MAIIVCLIVFESICDVYVIYVIYKDFGSDSVCVDAGWAHYAYWLCKNMLIVPARCLS